MHISLWVWSYLLSRLLWKILCWWHCGHPQPKLRQRGPTASFRWVRRCDAGGNVAWDFPRNSLLDSSICRAPVTTPTKADPHPAPRACTRRCSTSRTTMHQKHKTPRQHTGHRGTTCSCHRDDAKSRVEHARSSAYRMR